MGWQGYTSDAYRPRTIVSFSMSDETSAVRATIYGDRVTLSRSLRYSNGAIRWQNAPIQGRIRLRSIGYDGFVLAVLKDAEVFTFNGRIVEVTYLYYMGGRNSAGGSSGAVDMDIDEAVEVEMEPGSVADRQPVEAGFVAHRQPGSVTEPVIGVVSEIFVITNGAHASVEPSHVGDLPIYAEPYFVGPENSDLFPYSMFLDDIGAASGGPVSGDETCLPARQVILLNLLGLLTYYVPNDDDALLIAILLSLGYDRCDPKLANAGLIAGVGSRLFKKLFEADKHDPLS